IEVLSNIESKLGLTAIPANWPVGYGPDFQGVHDLIGKEMHLYVKNKQGSKQAGAEILGFDAGMDASTLSPQYKNDLREIIDLIADDFHTMDPDDFRTGKVSPVFFGSALNNFGLDLFLKYFAELAPTPKPYKHLGDENRDLAEPFSGFVFKMQANMNPDHRDCTAFVRIASGVFRRGIEVVLE